MEHQIGTTHTLLSGRLHIKHPPRQGLIEEPGVTLCPQKEAGLDEAITYVVLYC